MTIPIVHHPDYLARFAQGRLTAREQRQVNLPWSTGLVRRTFLAPSGTVLAAQLALQHGIACHLAGGTHHAHFDYASGFCILNDLAIAANVLLGQEGINRVLVFDVGVYEGDPLGKLNISEQGIRQRDRLVLSELKHRGIPVATVIGGGYDDNRANLAKRHGIVVEEACHVFAAS